MPQSTHCSPGLPACILAACLVAAFDGSAVDAQERYRVTRDENFRRDPGPNALLLASVREGAELEVVDRQSGWLQVVLDGWIWAESLRAIQAPGFDYEVSARNGENLRRVANGPVVARLQTGFWLEEVDRSGAWMRVRRTGWMFGRSLEPIVDGPPETPASPIGPPSEPRAPPPTEGDASLDRAVTVGTTALRRTPDGDSTGTLEGEHSVRILARSGEWLRVQTEGWVHERDVRPVSDGVLAGVSGAEVRARPEEFEGRMLQWTLQLLAVQTSDGVRRELPVGRRYLLTRGPMPETGFVYVLLPDEQVEALERLAPLAQLTTLVRVRAGRDRFLGFPVVELIEFSVRQP